MASIEINIEYIVNVVYITECNRLINTHTQIENWQITW